jgi:hypothetical protein
MPRTVIIRRPDGMPHEVHLRFWKVQTPPGTNGVVDGVVEADSAFAARHMLAQLHGIDPMSIRVEEVWNADQS